MKTEFVNGAGDYLQQINTLNQNTVPCHVPIGGETKFVKIRSIRALGKEPVYNMEVAEHHNYLINGGFVVHNCIDAVRYGCESVMPDRWQIRARRINY